MSTSIRAFALLALYFFSHAALAQSVFPNQGAAAAACESHVQSWRDFGSQYDGQCTNHPGPVEGYEGSQGYYYGFVFLVEYGPGSPVSGTAAQFVYAGEPDPCEDLVGTAVNYWLTSDSWPPTGIGCMDSPSPATNAQNCAVLIDPLSIPSLGDGDGSYDWHATVTFTGASCSPEEVAQDDTDGIEQEDAGDGWKCEITRGLCTDPQGNGKLCTFNPDGSRSACVDYKPGDGTDPAPEPDPDDNPDDPRDNRSATGGASCTAAPACSGDPIDCAQLWQQWKTRCAAEKQGSVSGAGCVNGAAVQLNCTNMDAARCFDLQMQAETVCRLSVLDGGDTGDGDDPFNKAGERADLLGSGNDGDGLGGLGPDDAWYEPGEGEGDGISSTLFGAGGGCPTLPAITIGNSTLSAPERFCDIIAMIRLLVIAVAYIWALKIVGE